MSELFGGKPRLYPMRLYGDPVLRRKARALEIGETLRVPGFESQTVQEVASTMLETMFEQRGVGLAAPQIGLPVQLFVAVEYEDEEEEGGEKPLRSRVLREYVMINPVLKRLTKKKDKAYQEGCLSIPGIYEEGVSRLSEVSVEYTDLDGVRRSLEAEDYLARVFQHELDHLQGVLFMDHLPARTMQSYRKELLSIQRTSKNYLDRLAAWEAAYAAQDQAKQDQG